MLDSATLTGSDKAIGSNLALKKVEGGASSLYQIDLMALKPAAGMEAMWP
jgi:hypothetical protein